MNTSSLRKYGTDPLVRGLLQSNSRAVDRFFTSALTNQLLAENSASAGMDLISINIQRGRDHGIPPYMAWKEWAKTECGIESPFKSKDVSDSLKAVYGILENIDLYPGALSEEAIEGGLVGATFACILSKTFKAVRDGDRFFYENSMPGGKSLGLSHAQIAEINNAASLSRVLCDNTDIKTIQKNAFLIGERVDCISIPSVNLELWNGKEQGGESESFKEELMQLLNADTEVQKALSVALEEEFFREMDEQTA